MSISKRFTGKLAVAAVAVAGVVGMVGAQPAGGLAASLGTGSMSASFTVQQIAEMEVTANNPTEENLVLDVDAVPTISSIVGNLGTIRVKTNSAGWDVLMTTDRGGRMLDKTSLACVSVPVVDSWGNPTGAVRDSCPTSGGTYLKWDNDLTASTPPIDVVLDVAIGVAKQGHALGNSGAPAKLFPLLENTTGGPSFIAPVKVINTKVIASTKNGASASVPVSFAVEIGTEYGTTSSPTGVFSQGIYGVTTTTGTGSEGAWDDIVTKGFPKPGAVVESDDGILPNVDPLEEYFYVNVGMPQTTFNQLEGNKGTFTETFHFDLVAKF
jgi:hypothetical protein